jgi:hypothetical protein
MSFQFKIQLKNIDDPLVWRRVVVPEQFAFLRFHKVIQAAFGWEDDHMFQFSPKGYASEPVIGMEDDHADYDIFDAKKIKLSEIFTHSRQKYTYIYDFGDDWIHEIKLEKMQEEKMLRATCIDGDGACPPEDCGGPWGYANLKEILKDKAHPEHRDMKAWLGLGPRKNWDATAFDLVKTNQRVSKV